MKQCIISLILFFIVSIAFSQTPRISVTNGMVILDKKSIAYTCTVQENFIPSPYSAAGSVITTSYLTNKQDTSKPVLFLFNGGPGASSSPLHMHAFGPVRLQKDGDTLKQINNAYSLLDVADLVFIDPIGTGFTRILDSAKASTFMDVAEDAKCIVNVIKNWLQQQHRQSSPVFICGESYGTIRACKMLTADEHFTVNGMLLFSPTLDMSLTAPVSGNDMPYMLNLPSMAAIAWYHNRIKHGNKTVQQVFNDAAKFASSAYLTALFKGNTISLPQKKIMADTLSKIYGLPSTLIFDNNLRVLTDVFEMSLLADRNLRIGKLNGQVALPVTKEKKEYSSKDDPSLVVNTDLKKDFVGRYFTNTLQFPGEGLYRTVNFNVNFAWKWGSMDAYLGYYSVLPDLEEGMKKNTSLKLFVAGGLYDLATPFSAISYLLDHSKVPKDRTTIISFAAGHSIFENEDQILPFMKAVKDFIRK